MVRHTPKLPEIDAGFDDEAWADAAQLAIETFISPRHAHRPRTEVRMLHDGATIAVRFRVDDRYVIAKGMTYQSRTHLDSCVEFFVEPVVGKGYFNFEYNCCGTLLLSYIEDARRKGDGFERYTMVPEAVVSGMEVHASLVGPILEEIQEPVEWTVSYRIPKSVFETYVGPLGELSGMRMRGNFYKCADESSHQHWGYWADIGEVLDFHQPTRFGAIDFE